MPKSVPDQITDQVRQILDRKKTSSAENLYSAWRLLAKYRALLIGNTITRRDGPVVQSGPFAGMTLHGNVSEGCFVPKLLGCYEEELHPVLRSLPAHGLSTVINIGCSEGFYAVGLAGLMPNSIVKAYDINPEAQKMCRSLASLNNIADRVSVEGEFKTGDFAAFAGDLTLVVCDIEGGEDELLDPRVAPALGEMYILVEFHEHLRPGVTDRVLNRFENTHSIKRITDTNRDIWQYPALNDFEPLDKYIAVWEWRSGTTPWAFLTPISASSKSNEI